MGTILLDSDKDGDPDLYVGSGGSEFPDGSKNGKFTDKTNELAPSLSKTGIIN